MSFEVRRPVKLSFRVRRNFATRDWTSIGLRGARAIFRKASTRTTAILPASALSHKSRMVGFDTPDSNPPLACRAPSEKDWTEWLWLGLILLAIAAAAIVRMMQ